MTDSHDDSSATTDQGTDADTGGETTVIASVEEVDAEVRAKLTGQSVGAIAEQAEAAFATVDVRLTGEQLAAYADAVSTGSAFDVPAAASPGADQQDVAEA